MYTGRNGPANATVNATPPTSYTRAIASSPNSVNTAEPTSAATGSAANAHLTHGEWRGDKTSSNWNYSCVEATPTRLGVFSVEPK